MIRERDGLSSPERHVKILRNASSGVIFTGYPLFWDITATGDGVRVGQCVNGGEWAFAGVALQDAAVGADLRVQTWGWGLCFVRPDVSIPIASGEILTPTVGFWDVGKDPAPFGSPDGKVPFLISVDLIPANFVADIQLRRVIIRG